MASISESGASWTPIDRDSYVPYYAQVKNVLEGKIESGEWQTGDQIPSEPELTRVFGVSRAVIRQALGNLEHEGLILRRQGKGTFVAGPKIVEGLVQKLTGFYQDMVERGRVPVTQVLKQEVVPVSPKVASYLGLEPGTPVIVLERLRFIDDEPILLVITYLPYHLCPGISDEGFSHQSLYACMEQKHGLFIARGHRYIEAVPAGEREAALLGVDVGAPLILLDSVSYLDDGTPIEYYRALHRGDRSRFLVELIRVEGQGSVDEALDGNLTRLPSGVDIVNSSPP